ncbi:hypothetical protein QPL79_06765 [Ignisphaera sp. 4213-co]|uniref:Uncharacterized protein n=1 Tax=Ignisphaera cupida TaxID=3050454 RepID=A0ABD4Z6W2_9CREN|nr:hypothetical protein [Ignisphaera sp. 4213-co]MDK6029061.1 hypothetical protein [Ignisphaera sp. 4213-co]
MESERILVKLKSHSFAQPGSNTTMRIIEVSSKVSLTKELIKVIENIAKVTLDPNEFFIICEDVNGNAIKVLHYNDTIPRECTSIYIYPQLSGGSIEFSSINNATNL